MLYYLNLGVVLEVNLLLCMTALLFLTTRTRRAEFITVNNGSGYNTSIQLYQLIGEIAYVNDEGKKSKKGLN